MNEKYNQFIKNTIDPDDFLVHSVLGDNACFYRACANSLYYRWKSTLKDEYFTIQTILNKQGEWVTKNIHELDLTMWDLDSALQTELAKEIQEYVRSWIVSNKDNQSLSIDLTYSQLVNSIHEITIPQYENLYKHFAADKIVQIINTGRFYKSGKRKHKPILQKCEIMNRWGGFPEQCALSDIFQIPIIVYMAQKYDIKKDKIITGKITRNDMPEKGVRYKMYQITGTQYLDTKPPLLLLWKKLKGYGHYYVLYQKNHKFRINKLGFNIKT